MAESQSAERETEATCENAMRAALEKGMEWCGDQDSRLQVLAKNVGVDPDDVDPDAALEDGPEGANDRHWVLARAEAIIADGEEQPLDAIGQAWDEHDEKIDADDDEPEPDEDESESGEIAEDSEENAPDEADDPLEEVADADVVGGGPEEEDDEE